MRPNHFAVGEQLDESALYVAGLPGHEHTIAAARVPWADRLEQEQAEARHAAEQRAAILGIGVDDIATDRPPILAELIEGAGLVLAWLRDPPALAESLSDAEYQALASLARIALVIVGLATFAIAIAKLKGGAA